MPFIKVLHDQRKEDLLIGSVKNESLEEFTGRVKERNFVCWKALVYRTDKAYHAE
jgi:hypothetical protein